MAQAREKNISGVMKNIYLLGFMGAGKSSAGRLLAARTGLAFRDLDSEIKKAAGMSAADIIEKRGLPAFRRLENSVLRKLSRQCGLVVATGGGVAPTKKRDFLKRGGLTVYLACREAVLLERLAGAPGRRPLLGNDPAGRPAVISRLLKRRGPYYARADIRVDVSALTPARTASKIAEAIKEHDKHFFTEA